MKFQKNLLGFFQLLQIFEVFIVIVSTYSAPEPQISNSLALCGNNNVIDITPLENGDGQPYEWDEYNVSHLFFKFEKPRNFSHFFHYMLLKFYNYNHDDTK